MSALSGLTKDEIYRNRIKYVKNSVVFSKLNKNYYPREDEYLFETTSQLRGFGNSFVVITRRISSENGNVFYEVWNPNEIELE